MSRFLREIHEQPAALRELLAYYRGAGAERLRAVCEPGDRGQRSLLFTGMGSSHHAPLAVRTQLGAAGIRVELAEAGELLHYGLGPGPGQQAQSDGPRPGRRACPDDLVLVAVSQSGESVETRQVVEALSGQCRIAAITNEPDSAVGRAADVVLPMCAGEEAAISTKTYTNTLGVLHLLAAELTAADFEAELARLDRVAEEMEAALGAGTDQLAGAAEFLEGSDFLCFVARGPTMAAAQQGALTFNEGARMPTWALSGGAFRHGPLELAGPDFSAVFLAPRGKTHGLIQGVAGEVAQAGGRVLLFGEAAAESSENAIYSLAMPDLGEDLFSAQACVPLELLLYHMAQQRGYEAGVFERIGKVTRRE